MKIGLHVNRFTWPGGPAEIAPRLRDIGQAADEAGFASLSVMDHVFQITPRLGAADDPMLEAYSALSYLAGVTQHLRLGAMVSAVVYREPGLLLKAVTSLDVLSGGRAFLGLGAAWYEREALGLGLPFPPLKERFERLEETLQIAKQVWAGDRQPFHGRYYRLAEPILCPPPVSQPHPPIMVGGSGERKTLRLVAQYADACNLFGSAGPGELAQKLDVLKRHCAALGRPYEEIERTAVHHLPAGATAAEALEACQGMAGVGIQRAIFSLPDAFEIRPLEMIGREVIPAAAEMP